MLRNWNQTNWFLQQYNSVHELLRSSAAIVYTDFIADIRPIVSSLSENGIQAVGYLGEMNAYSRRESYLQQKSGEAQAVVATKAFGMGIDMSDIRHVIRNGVPENILSWAQELGTRKVWTGWKNATATILYRKSDLQHANAWVLNNVSNGGRCKLLDVCEAKTQNQYVLKTNGNN